MKILTKKSAVFTALYLIIKKFYLLLEFVEPDLEPEDLSEEFLEELLLILSVELFVLPVLTLSELLLVEDPDLKPLLSLGA